MKKLLLFLFTGISVSAFAQHPCDSLKGKIHYSSSICVVDEDTLITIATGTGPFIYRWSPTGQTTDTIIVDPYDTFNIPRSVTIKDSCGDSITIPVIIKLETPVLSACCNSTILIGDSVLFITYGDIVSYHWSPPVHCLNPPLCDSVIATPTITTTYTVGGIDTAGCPAELALEIIVGYAGISSISQAKPINIYPNPSPTGFTFSLSEKAEIKLCDVTGRLLFSEIENAGTISVGKDLNPGIYFLFIDNKQVVKLVKM